MNPNDPTKTISKYDRYPAVSGVTLVHTYSADPKFKIEPECEEVKPPYWLYFTALWVLVCLLSAMYAYDAGWMQRQKEFDAAALKARSIEIPIEEITKP